MSRSSLSAALATAALITVPAAARAGDPLDTFDTAPRSRSAARSAAPDAPAPLRIVLQAGYDAGRYESGAFGTNDNDALIGLHLNEGPNFGVGVNWAPAGVPGGVQITLGYELSRVKAGSVEYAWSAVPFEVVSYLQLEPIRIGFGVSELLASSLKSKGAYPAVDIQFEVSTGWVFELGWVARMQESERGAQSSLGIRYVIQKVKADGIEYDASSAGAVVNFTL